jgi:hypothetical protein
VSLCRWYVGGLSLRNIPLLSNPFPRVYRDDEVSTEYVETIAPLVLASEGRGGAGNRDST